MKEHVQNDITFEYPRKNHIRSRAAAAACRQGAAKTAVRAEGSEGDGKTEMEITPSPVRRTFSALSDSHGYHTCYP